ncbi:hypothetical protein PSM7751_03720 [Pseudooceanicola marinus]|uniref:Gene transfer agent protein n=1 Tax=Pseudooceanicola marinus TaxID=396013 RepID=A0A1X7A4I5_9RHOB|nr:hypothetical protein [Pseudooceanicola marinus]PJE27154.1 hypothetical protein CVM50_17215 [Pseudooceanicola marinus]SLN70358.1 hypothetical protein PSM7751_03720 [Pseudooceanicola marinus]
MAAHGFQPVTLQWRGETITIPARGILPLVAEIEEILQHGTSDAAIEVLTRPSGPGFVKISQCLGAALRHMGKRVTDEEIYLSIDGALAKGDFEQVSAARALTIELIGIVSPALSREFEAEDAGAEK